MLPGWLTGSPGAVAGSGSSLCARRPHAACALFGCGPASPRRYPNGGRPPRYRPCSRVWAAIAVRTRTRVRAISRFGPVHAGLDMGAIYHSHTHTAPYPSQTDINFAANWPGLEWVIVGLADGQAEVRCYLIAGGDIEEVPLEVR